jgi:hypothetical protein
MARKDNSISKIFQTKRARLLYFLYLKRKIKNDSGVKSKLRRGFSYKSDGHLYHDLDLLNSTGLIEEKEGSILITKKGRAEFRLLETLRLTTLLAASFGLYLFVNTLLLYRNLPFSFQSPLFSVSFVLIAIAILCGYTFRAFKPLPPNMTETIE